MRTVIPIYFDYASTLCYIAWRITRELERELEIQSLWKGVPISLRDHRAKPGRELQDREREKVTMVSAETGIAVAPPSRWLDSSVALEGAELARQAGVFDAYHDGMFRAAFEERLDIGNLEVVTALATRAGLEASQFSDAIRSHAVASKLAEYKREADEFSAVGYPTFMLGDFPLIG